MNYPIWEVPFLGGSLVIAIIAIVHTYIAHFAVGGGFFLVLTERKAYREQNPAILDYVKKHNLFFILLTLVFGAITGVGIWFSISLVNPEATASLLNIFLWLWMSEWVLFFVEITSALVYFYTWDILDKKTHLIIGWIYAISSLLTLVMINAILSFMLTPGEWLVTKNFWHAVFNPTFISSTFIRIVGAFSLGGLFAFVTSSTIKDLKLKEILVKYSSW